MAHRVTAASLHAARVILKAYTLTVKPPERVPVGYIAKLTNSENHVATMIDMVSGIYRIAPIRSEVWHWQQKLRFHNAPPAQLAQFLRSFLEVVDMMPHAKAEELPVIEEPIILTRKEQGSIPQPVPFRVGKRIVERPAIEAAVALFQFYDIAPRGQRPTSLEFVAYEISLALNIPAVYAAARYAKRCLDGLKAGTITESTVADEFREMGVYLVRLPTYQENLEESKLLA